MSVLYNQLLEILESSTMRYNFKSDKDIFDIVCDIIMNEVPGTYHRKDITYETNFVKDLGFDSLTSVKFVMVLEEYFEKISF